MIGFFTPSPHHPLTPSSSVPNQPVIAYNPTRVSGDISQLEESLRDLPRVGALVKDRGYRQVWRFEASGKPYYLKFYPRAGFVLKRLVRGSPALREFTRLVALQKASVPSPRAVAVLSGFRINQVIGDAVIIEGLEPAVQLDRYLSGLEMCAQPVPERRQLAQRVRDLVQQLSRAKLGHSDLHLGNFLLKDGQVYLLDGYAVRPGGLRAADLLLLGHSARRFATTTDLLRGWRQLTSGGDLPPVNRASRRLYRKFQERHHARKPVFRQARRRARLARAFRQADEVCAPAFARKPDDFRRCSVARRVGRAADEA
jgi:hypothetical protein